METLAFFYYIDPWYFIYVGPAILMAMWAQMKVKSAYAQAGKVKASSGLSGAETAQRMFAKKLILTTHHLGVGNFCGTGGKVAVPEQGRFFQQLMGRIKHAIKPGRGQLLRRSGSHHRFADDLDVLIEFRQ